MGCRTSVRVHRWAERHDTSRGTDRNLSRRRLPPDGVSRWSVPVRETGVAGVRQSAVRQGETMKLLEKIRTDERAVSPVLGVALLIAMTVILAGVVGYVALGVDANSADAPQANLELTYDGSNVDLSHEGGAHIDTANLDVKVDGSSEGYSWTNANLTSGDVEQDIATVSSGAEVSVVWNDPDSDRTVLLAEYTVE